MQSTECPYQITREPGVQTATINCRNCTINTGSLFSIHCRNNIFSLLQKEPHLTKIILNHELIKIYQDESLTCLQSLAEFQENLRNCFNQFHQDLHKYNNDSMYFHLFQKLKDEIKKDPFLAAKTTNELIKYISKADNTSENQHIFKYFQRLINNLNLSSDQLSCSSHEFYRKHIRPYLRPGFIDSYIQLEPPPDALFIKSYEIGQTKKRSVRVSIYQRQTCPEKIYFLIPPEYALKKTEIQLLERIRKELSKHRPSDTTFLHAQNAREYFKRFAKKTLSEILRTTNIQSDHIDIGKLADMFSQYTAGLGILEDLLADEQIQDVYVNAPVESNPLHLIVNGEEYTSNIFLSTEDIEALASRFRTLSGRPFSEANPVLDMDLPQFHTRVAAVANPLTPKGTAMALRRHRTQPWTLAHFIKNRMITSYTAGLLSFLVDGQATILVAGSRGAGKTSLLSALLLEIPQRFRLLTIEDTAEIPVEQLQQKGYRIQSLLTKPMSSQSLSDRLDSTYALRTALRLGESVLVLGEVRGLEAKVLFEAMRVGAAGNLILGTIHGSTTQDVYERIVYDIGIPPTSFKAVDAVVIAAPVRKEGGIERNRRLTQISEISKAAWDQQKTMDHIFQDLMNYDTTADALKETELLAMGQSTLIQQIARKWGITVEKALENINLRAYIKDQIVTASKHNTNLLEADCIRDANNMFWIFLEQSKQLHESVDYSYIKEQWSKWFHNYCKDGGI